MSYLKTQTCSLAVAGLVLSACDSPGLGVSVQTDHECNEAKCRVEIEILNYGQDTFEIEYEVTAYKRRPGDSNALVGELAGSQTVRGGQSITLIEQFPVRAKPNSVATSTSSTRLR